MDGERDGMFEEEGSEYIGLEDGLTGGRAVSKGNC